MGYSLNTFDKYKNESEIAIVIAMRLDYNLKHLLRIIKVNPFVKIIYLMTEEQNICPLHSANILQSPLFDLVLTWSDDMVDDDYFIKYQFFNPFRQMVEPIPFLQKSNLCMIVSYKTKGYDKHGELYSERIKAIRHFTKKEKIDLYGMGWEKLNDPLIKKAYKGSTVSKIDTLKKYKFSIAFENTRNEPGSICEKIFDVMAAGCVPVYWGAPNVLDYIPEDAFIDYRKFNNYSELDTYLSNISEREYNIYLNAISKFLESDSYRKFTSFGFSDRISYALRKLEKQPQELKSIWHIKLDFVRKILLNMRHFFTRRRFIYDLITS